LSSSSSNDLSSDDKPNQDEKSDNNASAEDCGTKNLDGLEVNLERCHEQNIDNLPLDKNAAQIVQQGHPLAKKLPLQLNLRPSASQHLIYHVSLPLSNVMAVYQLKCLTRQRKLSLI
jgi:hypothetical protein